MKHLKAALIAIVFSLCFANTASAGFFSEISKVAKAIDKCAHAQSHHTSFFNHHHACTSLHAHCMHHHGRFPKFFPECGSIKVRCDKIETAVKEAHAAVKEHCHGKKK